MTPIWNYLKHDTSPEDKANAAKANHILNEIYRGVYKFHSSGQTMVARVLSAGYYWPTMREDCQCYVHNCQECQAHDPVNHSPAKELQHVTTPWPFSIEAWTSSDHS
ncbi:hypothetical protein CR513_44851, partial [Mucuna pruriens]